MHRFPGSSLRTVAAAGMLALAVGACAASSSTPTSGGGGGAPVGAATMAPLPPAGVADRDAAEGPVSPDDGSDPLAIATGPAIVRTGTLSLEVADLDAALLRARAAVVGVGGYVSDSQRTNADGGSLAAITYRIPADRWDDALDALRGIAAKLLTEDTRAVEVTGQLVDLDARIANLRVTEQALQSIMARATRIADILEVQNQLTTVQGQIEQLTAQRARLADQAAFATLTVTWSVPLVAVAEATEGWDFGAEVDRAFAQLVQLGQGLLVLALWLAIVGLPVVAGVGLAIGLAALVVRRLGIVRRPAA